jgi:hypothetical protein
MTQRCSLSALLAGSAAALVGAPAVRPCSAQQAIVSLPSPDVTPAKKIFLMQESQVRGWEPGPYWNTTNFYCFGLDGTTELAVTTFNLGVPETGNASVANGFKSVFPVLPSVLGPLEIKATVGAMVLFSLDDRGVGYWVYGHLSGRIPGLGTRLAAGVSIATEQLYARRAAAFITSLEQPLFTPKLNLVAEWFSGEHDLGNFIYGLSYHPDKTWIFVAGHKIPTNQRFGKNKDAVVGEIGVFF